MDCIYLETLKKEVIPAEGCTEPIAVAYATAVASDLLGEEVQHIALFLSANIIKNAMGVGIPGTGKVGLDIAATLGVAICNPEKKLEILSNFTKEELRQAETLMDRKIITTKQKFIDEKLYIEVHMQSEHHKVEVVIAREHTNVIFMKKDDQVLKEVSLCDDSDSNKGALLTISGIYEFATTVPFDIIKFLLTGAEMNQKVSDEGLKGGYGLEVGNKITTVNHKNILCDNVANQIIAATAAASDARMDGCTMPIMTTAGSGNQGIACSMPVIALAGQLKETPEKLARALAISHLIVCHIKEYMGRLSPLCGAGIAGATGASCGITYLMGGDLHNIKYAINNMLADMTGMICDGAKTTCALKIATATNAAIQCSTLAMNDISPTSKEGIIFEDVEETVKHIGKLISGGLKEMDATILDIMLNK